MGSALQGGMHATTFALKRCHLLAVAMLRAHLKPYAPLRITPARADLFNLFRAALPYSGPHMRQREIHKRLGVTRATVSRMLIQLEKMGLIERWPRDTDRRQKMVRLSRRGRAMHRVVVRWVMNTKVVDRSLQHVLRAAPGQTSCPHAAFFLDLRIFADRLGDRSRSPYPATPIGEPTPRWPWPSIQPWAD